MNITEIRVKLVNNENERLRAFCSATLDGEFVIRDLKVIEGANGPFVAMPSRRLADKCRKCGSKNHLRAKFCNECGGRLNGDRAPKDNGGRVKLYADVAHPINAACREQMQNAVVAAYREELEKSKQPGYQPQVWDEEDDFNGSEYEELISELKQTAPNRSAARREPERRPVTDPPAAPAASRRLSVPELSGSGKKSDSAADEGFGSGIL